MIPFRSGQGYLFCCGSSLLNKQAKETLFELSGTIYLRFVFSADDPRINVEINDCITGVTDAS